MVQPVVPPAIHRLSELAYNVFWSWDHRVRGLFRRLDSALWKSCGHNPVLMLGRVPQAALEKAAADPRFVALYRHACERYDSYIQGTETRQGPHGRQVAYFSMEYGLAECMPIYSGGLGLLSGDHLKGASDLGLDLVAVGLLYQKGYLRQALNPDGWQTERSFENDFYTLPVTPVTDASGQELKISLPLPRGPVIVKVWRILVGRVSLIMLDTNIPDNRDAEYRDITDQLYGGDVHTRIRQEIVLGIGGIRALRALGLNPSVYHMNEGHSAFLAIERVRELMQEHRLTFDEALEATRVSNVFTTHTSVPAGIDLFDPSLLHEYLGELCDQSKIPFDRLLALGRSTQSHERFSMAVLALQTSAYRNAVSKLHRHVSQEMWQPLWDMLPSWEVPITSITNGIHLPTWINGDLSIVYDQYLQPDWRERYQEPQTWDLVREIPESELWEVRRKRKRLLVTFVRNRVSEAAVARKASAAELRRLSDVLDPDALTIGFARRFATYKRATLLFRDPKRLKKLLTNADRPLQIVIAGKAHPKDHPGKSLIREIVQLARDPELYRHLVFVEDYGIEVARELVHAVDLWLNNPRRGEEACGTSGIKAGINGVLNLSILDGWFDEAYEVSGGWAVGDRDPYSEDQDEIHASAIYSILENEIVPMYYEGRDEGVPVEWMRRVKESLRNLTPYFNSQRMVEEYTAQLYEPAHQAAREMSRDGYHTARERARWSAHVVEFWPKVRFVGVDGPQDHSVLAGRPVPLQASLDLAGLAPEDVRVEAVIGKIASSGSLEDTEIVVLPPVAQEGGLHTFSKEFVPSQTGRLGFSVRVSSNHFDDPITRPCHSLVKWGSGV